MSMGTTMEKSGAYLVSERHRRERSIPERPRLTGASVTISRQIGTGAPEIAGALAQVLQEMEESGSGRWEVFDQQLVEKALLQHDWPKKLAETIAEEKRFFIDEVVDDLFSLRPPSWVIMPQLVETTRNLAMAGHAILVGHGATVITVNLPNVYHVRLTGSLPRRIERIQKARSLTYDEAAKLVRLTDHRRKKYLRAHFDARPDDELLYDLTINTDRISNADAVTIIAEGARRFFSKL